MIEKNYYSLRISEANAFHAKDDVLKTTNKVLHIGETADCGIRFECGGYEPERYASIVENEDGKSWRLIQRSQHVKAKIAGSGDFGYVHQLKDGDVITFEGQDLELEFHTHFDGSYGKEGFVIEHIIIEQPKSKKLLLFGFIAAVLILGLLGLGLYNYWHRDIRYKDIKDFEESVFLVRVDSVQWIAVSNGDTTLVEPTANMDGCAPVGTAFLTKDGKLITARHCIEYWIGEDVDDMPKTRELNDVKKWAILSETYNYLKDESVDSVQMLRVFFTICVPAENGREIFSFSSTDPCVHINRSRDGRLELGDYDNIYYWRSIQPSPYDLERELGDIVCIDVDTTGVIGLADSTMIAELNPSSSIGILGLPGNLTERNIKHALGHIMEDRSDTIGVNPDIQFDANITHGFSGGPVFIKTQNGLVVAGVVSKIDTENGIYKKAVPVTEIDYMLKKEKEGEDE